MSGINEDLTRKVERFLYREGRLVKCYRVDFPASKRSPE